MKAIFSSVTMAVSVICLLVVLSCSSFAQTNSWTLPPPPPTPHDGDYVLTVQGDTGALKWVPFGDVRCSTNALPFALPLLPPPSRRLASTNTLSRSEQRAVAPSAQPDSGVLSDEDYYARVLTGKATNDVMAYMAPLTNQLSVAKAGLESAKREYDDGINTFNQNRDPNLEKKLTLLKFRVGGRERDLRSVERRIAIVEQYLHPSPATVSEKKDSSNKVPEDTARKLADPQH